MTTQKATIRRQIVARRRAMGPALRTRASQEIENRLLEWLEESRAQRVCAYVPMGTEPGAIGTLDAMQHRGVGVLLPVCSPQGSLDWATYTGPEHLVRGPFGTRQPDSALLGVEALEGADIVLAPALAVDRAGHRLGRGGGFYDRSMATLPPSSVVAAVVFAEELLDQVPTDEHDRPVSVVLTPAELLLTHPDRAPG